jgi:Tol biopolymer transport system component
MKVSGNGGGRLLLTSILLIITQLLSADYQLTFGYGSDSRPAWSPDGGKIAFVTNRDGDYEIYAIPARGGTAINLTNNSASDLYPNWSKDGSKITFTSDRSGNYDIWVMNADGSNQTQITTSTSSDTDSDFSPDGYKITYSSLGGSGWENNWLCTIPAFGGIPIQIINNSTNNYHPRWSPDGTYIAFQYDPFGAPCDIYTINMTGGELTRITDGTSSYYDPAWSPDGGRIAFDSMRSVSTDYDIWIKYLYLDQYIRVTSKSGNEFFPCWSPDGSKIAYDYTDSTGARHIWITDAPARIELTTLGQIKAIYR